MYNFWSRLRKYKGQKQVQKGKSKTISIRSLDSFLSNLDFLLSTMALDFRVLMFSINYHINTMLLTK